MHRNLLRALALFALLALPTPTTAQCLGPDGLNGPCCSLVAPNLPQFGSISLPGTSICWVSCVPQPQQNSRVQIDTPIRTACGQYVAPITILDAMGATILGGTLSMDYTRTWEEVTPGPLPQQLQVYRFAIKIDIATPGQGLGNTCNVPSCIPSLPSAFYYGYLDYAFDCALGTQTNALVLFHNCDDFIHDPAFSATPGAFHPTMTYALVYPSTAVNPFVAGFLPAPGGAMVGEALRLEPPIGSVRCYTEDPIGAGTVTPLGNGCACPLQVAPLQVTGRRMTGKGTCPTPGGTTSFFVSLNLFPTFPWFSVMTTSLGSWTTGAAYPGPESVWVDEGIFFMRDVCSQLTGGARKFAEVYYGGTTDGGFQVIPSATNATITQRMTDLASNVSNALPGPIATILVGTVRPTRNLIYPNY